MVFVLDKHHKPLMPCTEKRARLLLERGRARIHKMYPFTIRLVDRLQENSGLQETRIKLDPGSKTTGVAVTLDGATGTKAILLGEIVHKTGIKEKLDSRRMLRRNRRNRKTRYRKARFLNRKKEKGWLPPSLESRVSQTLIAVKKIIKSMPVKYISFELVKFDTQKMQKEDISGTEYQQGTLVGYEVREYLLEKWERKCVYCDAVNIPLEIEHIIPKSRGGSNRISNLTLACRKCNQKKGSQTAEEYGFPDVQRQVKKSLKDASIMNATRWRLFYKLKELNLPVEAGSGARTKMQRIAHNLPKEHYYDALCVGKSTPEHFTSLPKIVQIWSAKGRGTRQMCRTNKYGFPISHRQRKKNHFGFQTGDLVVAKVPKGKYQGVWKGQVAVRSSGYFDLKANGERMIQGVSHRFFRVLQRSNGWQYQTNQAN